MIPWIWVVFFLCAHFVASSLYRREFMHNWLTSRFSHWQYCTCNHYQRYQRMHQREPRIPGEIDTNHGSGNGKKCSITEWIENEIVVIAAVNMVWWCWCFFLLRGGVLSGLCNSAVTLKCNLCKTWYILYRCHFFGILPQTQTFYFLLSPYPVSFSLSFAPFYQNYAPFQSLYGSDQICLTDYAYTVNAYATPHHK